MKHRRIIGLIALVMLLACVTTIPVLAQWPCQFKGTVTLNGSPVVPADTTITAKLDDGTVVMEISGDPFIYVEGGVSKYVMVIPQEDGVVLTNGTTLEFFVNGYYADTGTWTAGEQRTLNLAASAGATYTLTVTVSPTGKGTVSKSPNMAQYPAGTPVTLTANAISGWDFDKWSGTDNNTINPTTVTMNANKSVTAYFEEEPGPAADTFKSWLYDKFVKCLMD